MVASRVPPCTEALITPTERILAHIAKVVVESDLLFRWPVNCTIQKSIAPEEGGREQQNDRRDRLHFVEVTVDLGLVLLYRQIDAGRRLLQTLGGVDDGAAAGLVVERLRRVNERGRDLRAKRGVEARSFCSQPS